MNRRIVLAAQRAALSLGIAVLLVATQFTAPRAYAAQPDLAALAVHQVRAAREADIAATSGKLEAIAAELRRIRPFGEDAPALADVQSATGDAAPSTLAKHVLQLVDELGDFETRIETQWREEADEMTALGIPGEVVARHRELLDEVRAKAARFRELVVPLRSGYARQSVGATATALLDLSGWFAEQSTTKAYKAIEKAQLPLQFARTDTTPAPGLQRSESAPAPNAFTDPPGAGELAPTLDIEFTPEIRALAQSLGGQPVAIRNWVYDNVEFTPTFGSIQGSGLTLLNRRGNAFDIASLTLALLRVSNVPARYAHGVVEIPVDKVQNWLGNLATPQMVVELMQKGGIPAAAVIAGGRIVAVRFEHVWVEAWVDFIPSRGAINRVPDQWVPLDVAYKQFDYVDALPWRSQTLQAHQNAIRDFAQRVTVDANGGIKGFDFDRLNASLQTIATDYANATVGGAPATTPTQLYDERTIRPVDSLILHGSLPFPLRSANVSRYIELPATLRQSVRIAFFADETSLRYDSPTNEVVLPLARIGTQRLTMDYVPASAADAQTIATYADSNAASLPVGQVNVIPKLMLGDETLFASGGTRMGTQHFWKVDVRDTHGNETVTEAYKFAAGSQILFGSDLTATTAGRVERESAQWPDVAYVPTKEALYQANLLYWLMTDHMDDQAARSVGGRALRMPSVGAFAQPLQVRYFFGVPRTGFVAGNVTDLKAVRIGTSVPRAADAIQLSIHLGSAGSINEGVTWNVLGGTGRASLGLSAATLLKTAIDEGQRLFQIDRNNVNAALAQLQLSADAEDEIRQGAAAGLTIVAHEREIQYRGWSGSGYVIIDLATGSSLQRVEGGLAGGINIGCIVKAVSLKALCNSKIFKIASRYLLGMLARLGARAIAMAGLTAMFAAVAPVAGVVLPILAAVGTAISIAMAVYEVSQWVRQIMDGIETLTPEELAELGISAINAIACSYAPPCFGGFGAGGGGGGGGGDGTGAGGPMAGNPVAIGSGAKWQTEYDYAGEGVFPLLFERTYVSMVPRAQNWVGSKWTATYFQNLRLPPAVDGETFPTDERPDSVMLNRPDGGWFQFDWRTNGYYAESNIPGRLERLVAGGQTTGWVYTTIRDEVERYDAQGHLLSIANRAGVTHTLTYDALMRPIRVTDTFNRTLEFGYDADTGYLATLTDPTRRVTTFSHDDDGNLTKADYADGKSRTYHYEDAANRFNLTGITDERNVRSSSWTYDHLGRASSSVRAGGVERYTFRYEEDKTVVTDPLGTERTYEFARIFDRTYVRKVTEPCASCGSGTADTTYDGAGRVASRRDFEGNLTVYGRGDPRGLITSLTQASGTPLARTYATTWHASWYLPRTVSEPVQGGSRTTTFEYDAEGNLSTRTVAAGSQARVWTYTYDANGQMLSADGPRSDVVDRISYTYDAATGNRSTMTDAAGHTTQYTNYDADGRLLESVDANGKVVEYRYDARGRRTHVVEKDSAGDPGEATTYAYTPEGSIDRVTFADASFVDYDYDSAGRLTDIVDSAGNRAHFTLDALGNRTDEAISDTDGTLAQSVHRVVDALGRIDEVHGANAGEVTRYTYDGDGNERTIRDALDHVVTYDYDDLARLQATRTLAAADPDSSVVSYGYDADDNVSRVTDARNLATVYGYDGYGNLSSVQSPDTGTTRYGYDASGNLVSRTDARGQRGVYAYDAANRLASVRHGTASPTGPTDLANIEETVVFSYDEIAGGSGAKGRLTTATDGAGAATYAYDPQGRITAFTQRLGNGSTALTKSIASSYDGGGRLVSSTLPSGAQIAYGYGVDGRASSITVNGVAVVVDVEYFPFGDIKGWTEGASGGFRYARTFDGNGRVDHHTLGGAVRDLHYDLAGRVDGLIDTAAAGSSVPATARSANWTFSYDGHDRLKTAANAATQGPLAGLGLAWTYDATGNRIREVATGSAPRDDAYTVASASNRLAAIGAVARTYDDAGNTASDGTYRYGVNAANRLSSVRLQGNGAVVARYAYNGVGERVCKALTGGSCPLGPGSGQAPDAGSGVFVQFVYDTYGRLVGEYASDGSLIAEHIWLDDTPVAVLKPASYVATHGGRPAGGATVFWVEPDHIGASRVVVNAAHDVVWRWDSAPFGDTTADESPGGAALFAYALRFPGQYYDPETRSHYNYYRDYQPSTGRYLQSDPIGIAADVATYTYVGSDPLWYSDPLGLARKTPSRTQCGCEVLGKGQNTGGRGHARRSEQIANILACTGMYVRIGINISLRRLTGNKKDPLYRPDVCGLKCDGTIDVIEVPSPTDNKPDLNARAVAGLAGLNLPNSGGKIRITPKCCKK